MSTYFSKSQIESAIRRATDIWCELDGAIDFDSSADVDTFITLVLGTLELDHGPEALSLDISLYGDQKAIHDAVSKFITQKFKKAGIVL